MASPKQHPKRPGFFSKIRRQFSLAPSREQGAQVAPGTSHLLRQKERLLNLDGKLNIVLLQLNII